MAAGDKQYSSTGETRWNSTTGDAVVSSASNTGCCCGGACPQCNGTTPASFTVSFTGTTICNLGNCLASGFSDSIRVTGPGLGTYDVAYGGGASCGWQYVTTSSGFVVTYHAGSSICGGSGVAETTTLTIDVFAGGVGLSARAQLVSAHLGTAFLFNLVPTAPHDCTAHVVNNSATGACAGVSLIGRNGTATITPA
jgi:hypothetical protein